MGHTHFPALSNVLGDLKFQDEKANKGSLAEPPLR